MIEDTVHTYLQSKLPQARDLRLSHFRRHTEGWSWETFSFNAQWQENGNARQQGFVLRKEPDRGGAVGK
jgi:hypothetical protein